MYFLAAITAAVVFVLMGLFLGDQGMLLTGINGALVVLVGLGVVRGIEEHGKGA